MELHAWWWQIMGPYLSRLRQHANPNNTFVSSRYCQTFDIRHTKSQYLNVSHLIFAVVFAQSIEARCLVENEDVFGAAPTGVALTKSEWSTILLPTIVQLILEVWRYFSCLRLVPVNFFIGWMVCRIQLMDPVTKYIFHNSAQIQTISTTGPVDKVWIWIGKK